MFGLYLYYIFCFPIVKTPLLKKEGGNFFPLGLTAAFHCDTSSCKMPKTLYNKGVKKSSDNIAQTHISLRNKLQRWQGLYNAFANCYNGDGIAQNKKYRRLPCSSMLNTTNSAQEQSGA